MLVASLIDLDEQTIPDAITVPGTLAGFGTGGGLSLVAVAGRALARRRAAGDRVSHAWLSPEPWPPLDGLPCRRWRSAWLLDAVVRRPVAAALEHAARLATAVRVFVHRLRAERLTY